MWGRRVQARGMRGGFGGKKETTSLPAGRSGWGVKGRLIAERTNVIGGWQ